jgi:hypothetical protein
VTHSADTPGRSTAPRLSSAERLVTTRDMAARLSVSARYLREHWRELGAIPLPVTDTGKRPYQPLRWDVQRTLALLGARSGSEQPQVPESPAPARRKARKRRARSGTGAPLLPIGPRLGGGEGA